MEWRPIPNFSQYEVSPLGQVRSIDRIIKWRGVARKWNGKLLKLQTCRQGYLKVSIINDLGERKTIKVHRIVALAFLGKSNLTVNHKDFNKLNNCVFNLEYLSRSENSLHFHKNKKRKMPTCENHKNSKLSNKQVLEILKLKGKISQRKIAKIYNISPTCVGYIHRRITYRSL